MRAQVVHQARILRRGFGVAAAKAHGGARRLGQGGHVAIEGVLVVEHEKCAVIRRKRPGQQPLGREAHTHLAEEHHGLRLRALEHADGRLHVEKAVQLERAGHPHNAARGAAHEADGAELGRLRIVQLAQAVVDLALDALQLRLLARDGGLLLAHQLLDAPDVAVAQKGADLPERHIQRAQVADGVEHLKLPRPVVAVAGRGVGVFRRKQADGLIVAQAAHAQVKQLRHVADGKQLLCPRHVTPPPARAGRAGAARETRSRR